MNIYLYTVGFEHLTVVAAGASILWCDAMSLGM
jgi:hypothetical protein